MTRSQILRDTAPTDDPLTAEEREIMITAYDDAREQIAAAPDDAPHIDLARQALSELDDLGGPDHLEREGLISTVDWIKERVREMLSEKDSEA